MNSTIAEYTVMSTVSEDPTESVYLAQPPTRLQAQPGPVVLKVINGQVAPDRFRRMANELRLFGMVDSPYLATMLDAGIVGDRIFYAVEQPPLGTLAEPTFPLTQPEILRAVAHAARGAHALHEAGIAHRDIQPGSVLLHEGGARLGDMQLARFIEPGMTVTSSAPVGAIEFVDPAIIRGDRAGRASDIWSLGATLHRALTGKSVYGEDLPTCDLLNAVRRVLSDGTAIDSTISPAAGAVVRACLAPTTDRPLTALAVAEQIEAL